MKFGNTIRLPASMRAWAIAGAIASLIVPQSPASQTAGLGLTETAKIGPRVVELQSRATTCVLSEKISNSAIQLDLPGPCRFSRRGLRATPQQFDYPKIGIVIYVFGRPEPLEAFAGRAQIKASDQCSNHAQAVIFLRTGKIETRPAKDSGIYCPDLGLDEKDFHGAAFPVN